MQGAVILAQGLGEALRSKLGWQLFSLSPSLLLLSLTPSRTLVALPAYNRNARRLLCVLTPLCLVSRSTAPYATAPLAWIIAAPSRPPGLVLVSVRLPANTTPNAAIQRHGRGYVD